MSYEIVFFFFVLHRRNLLNSDRIMGKGNISIVFPLFSEVKSKVIKGENILYLGLELKNHANCGAGNPAWKPALESNCVCPLVFLQGDWEELVSQAIKGNKSCDLYKKRERVKAGERQDKGAKIEKQSSLSFNSKMLCPLLLRLEMLF